MEKDRLSQDAQPPAASAPRPIDAGSPAAGAAPQWADNSARWPGLAALLAPSAGCDCQLVALLISDEIDAQKAAPSATPPSGRSAGH